MNKFEKIKELLGYIKDGIDYETNAIVVGNDELSIVAEALEKQIPNKPILKDWVWECSVCGH